jgi:type IV secretory pathway VirB2 component (pilin)
MDFLLNAFGFGGDGPQDRQNVEQTYNLSSISEVLFEKTTNLESVSQASGTNIQSVVVNVQSLDNCTLEVNQRIDATVISKTTLDSADTSDIQSTIQSMLQSSAEAAIDRSTELGTLSFLESTEQNILQDVTSAIETLVSTKLSMNALNNAIATLVNIQGETLNLGTCVDSDILFTQNITAKLTAEAITNSVTDALMSTDILNQLAAAANGQATSKDTGFATMLEKLFEGLTGPMKYALIASIVCCCALIMLVIVMSLSPAGQNATRNLGRAGANRLGR